MTVLVQFEDGRVEELPLTAGRFSGLRWDNGSTRFDESRRGGKGGTGWCSHVPETLKKRGIVKSVKLERPQTAYRRQFVVGIRSRLGAVGRVE